MEKSYCTKNSNTMTRHFTKKENLTVLALVILFLACMFAGCGEMGCQDPSIQTVSDTLIEINAAAFDKDKEGHMCGTSLPGGVGFTYQYYSGLCGSVMMLTTNDSIYGIIIKNLQEHHIPFDISNSFKMYDNVVMHDIRYDSYYLPKYFTK
jgi:hypothetical protein